MAEKTWKGGNLVRLASGGPAMTVKWQFKPTGKPAEVAVCQWFEKGNDDLFQLFEGEFAPDSLIEVK
jgi:uncharacterized protein YodC (DUF2158 family)